MTNEPWAADEAINRNAELERNGGLGLPSERQGGSSAIGSKLTPRQPPASSRPGVKVSMKKKNRPTWDAKTTTFESRPAWDNSKTTAWDVSIAQDRVARAQAF